MNLETIVKTLNLKVLSGEGKLKRNVTGGYAGDLLSDVIAHSREGQIWITRQIHQNIVAVATLKEHAAIILVHSNTPPQDTLDKARGENVVILVSDLPAFELTGKLYNLLNP